MKYLFSRTPLSLVVGRGCVFSFLDEPVYRPQVPPPFTWTYRVSGWVLGVFVAGVAVMLWALLSVRNPSAATWLQERGWLFTGAVWTQFLASVALWVTSAYLLGADLTLSVRARRFWIFALALGNLLIAPFFVGWRLYRRGRERGVTWVWEDTRPGALAVAAEAVLRWTGLPVLLGVAALIAWGALLQAGVASTPAPEAGSVWLILPLVIAFLFSVAVIWPLSLLSLASDECMGGTSRGIWTVVAVCVCYLGPLLFAASHTLARRAQHADSLDAGPGMLSE